MPTIVHRVLLGGSDVGRCVWAVKLLEGNSGVARVIARMVTHFGDGDISGGALLGAPAPAVKGTTTNDGAPTAAAARPVAAAARTRAANPRTREPVRS